MPFKKGMYLHVKADKSAWAEARVLLLVKGTVSIESLFIEPTYSAKTKRVYAVPSKLATTAEPSRSPRSVAASTPRRARRLAAIA